jgi:hypothetical protein
MNMQEDLGELMKVGRREGAERRRLGLLNNSGGQGESMKGESSQGTEHNSTLNTGLRTVTETADMEDDEVIFEMEKGPRRNPPPPPPQPRFRSRWMRRQQTATMGTQTIAPNPANLAMKMEGLNLEKKRETELQQEILRGSLRQERLKKQLEECSRNGRQELATATSVDGSTSCRGATASRRASGPEDDNTDNWQAELLHDVDEDTFEKLDREHSGGAQGGPGNL